LGLCLVGFQTGWRHWAEHYSPENSFGCHFAGELVGSGQKMVEELGALLAHFGFILPFPACFGARVHGGWLLTVLDDW